jgi:hypothetical protein
MNIAFPQASAANYLPMKDRDHYVWL